MLYSNYWNKCNLLVWTVFPLGILGHDTPPCPHLQVPCSFSPEYYNAMCLFSGTAKSLFLYIRTIAETHWTDYIITLIYPMMHGSSWNQHAPELSIPVLTTKDFAGFCVRHKRLHSFFFRWLALKKKLNRSKAYRPPKGDRHRQSTDGTSIPWTIKKKK